MPDGQVLEFDRVTKRFSDVTAVSDFSGRVEPGVVTGFLGPNGAGKTTTLRMLLGQIRPTSGTATIGGAQYSDLKHPARVIGAMHEDPGFRPRRSVERHLIVAAKANGIALSRVTEVISFVGLDGEADTRIGALSLGMRQRLSAATALLGDPGALVLDEPANGLDPEGIRWMRMLIRGLADEGRTVLVSSHVLSEVEQVADEILVIARGQRKFAGSLAALADPTSGPVVVDAVDRSGLTRALHAAGFDFEVLRSGLTVRGSDARTIGTVAADAGVALTTLQQRGPTLEDVFLDLVNDRPVQLRKPDVADATFVVPVVADVPDDADAATRDAASAVLEGADTAEDVESGTGDAESETVEAAPDTEHEAEPGTVAAETVTTQVPPGSEAESETGSDAVTDDDDEEAAEAGSADVAADAVAGIADGDEDDVAADEIDSFAPVSAVEDRPLPGIAGLAAAAAGLSQADDDTDTSPNPAVSDAWAALIAGRPLDEAAHEQSAGPEQSPGASHEPEHLSDSAHPEQTEQSEAPASEKTDAEYTEFAHEQHVADGDEAPAEHGGHQHGEHQEHPRF